MLHVSNANQSCEQISDHKNVFLLRTTIRNGFSRTNIDADFLLSSNTDCILVDCVAIDCVYVDFVSIYSTTYFWVRRIHFGFGVYFSFQHQSVDKTREQQEWTKQKNIYQQQQQQRTYHSCISRCTQVAQSNISLSMLHLLIDRADASNYRSSTPNILINDWVNRPYHYRKEYTIKCPKNSNNTTLSIYSPSNSNGSRMPEKLNGNSALENITQQQTKESYHSSHQKFGKPTKCLNRPNPTAQIRWNRNKQTIIKKQTTKWKIVNC